MGDEYTVIVPVLDPLPVQTVWVEQDEAIQRLGDRPPQWHWSRQMTQPLTQPAMTPWPGEQFPRTYPVGILDSRAVKKAMQYGALVILLALGLLLALSIGTALLPGRSLTASEMVPLLSSVEEKVGYQAQPVKHSPQRSVPNQSAPGQSRGGSAHHEKGHPSKGHSGA